MRARSLALVLVLTFLGGCTTPDDDRALSRDAIPFAVASSLNGVEANARTGDLALAAGRGIVLDAPENATNLTVSLAPVAQSAVFHACVAECVRATLPRGVVLAEAGIVSLENLTLNADGPDGDSAIFFGDDGSETGRFVRWNDGASEFQVNGEIVTSENLTALHHVGSRTPLTLGDGGLVFVQTAALEGAEVAVFARGSSRLVNGTANVTLPSAFSALVGRGPLTAQVSLTSDGPTIYVAQKSAGEIVVRATGGAESDATFDWFVQATRKGGEDFRP